MPSPSKFDPFLDACTVVQSPPDPRDWVYESQRRNVRPVLMESLDLRPTLRKVRSQGRRGTCAAFTGTCVLESLMNKNNGSVSDYFSPEFVFRKRSNYPNSGMHGRNVCEILIKEGACTETTFPYNEAAKLEDNMIPVAAALQAPKYKADSYSRVDTVEGLKMALTENGACYISFPAYNSSSTFWKPASPDQVLRGGHAVTAVGYNTKGFIIRNSWGDDWANDGYTIYPYSDWEKGMHWDVWTVASGNTTPVPLPPSRSAALNCCTLL
jgi:C1A family cysteine protease